jgi:hypothetical protein
MPKIIVWSPEEAKQNLAQRLQDAQDRRRETEKSWKGNEQTIFNTQGLAQDVNINIAEGLGMLEGPDQGTGSVTINYAFKNLRFLHAQLAANPPSVIPRPTSSDAEDRRKADAADRVVRYGMKQYDMQENVDKLTLNALLYGSGVAKVLWDSNLGDILEIAEESGELTMEGDFRMSVPNIWNLYFDADAESFEDVRFAFERIYVPYEEALYKWPEQKELLQKYRSGGKGEQDSAAQQSQLGRPKYDVVELWEYWEKGLASNGMLGRHTICTRDGTPLTGIHANPERYAAPKKGKAEASRRIEIACLPYHLLTDIDVPGTIWGKSFLEYVAPIQDTYNRFHSVSLDIMQAHGVARLVIPEGAEVSPDSITNSTWDVVKYTGTQPPHFMEPMPFPAALNNFMDIYKIGIDDMSGVNEAMFGKQSREQSGFSMQYATNQGNMIRFRLLNKYRRVVESIYKSYLKIVQKHWTLPHTILVLGNEKAFEAQDIKGADIDGGYDLTADYGASLSLDPTTRREEMITLMPLFEKAGVESRQLLKMLKLNELSGQYDLLELADNRQREIFETMIATGVYIAPEELQDHKNMLSYSYMFLMTSEYKYLEDDAKALIKQHVKEREMLAAQGAAPSLLAGAPGPLPQGLAGGMPPSAPGMQAGLVDNTQLA